MAYFAVHAKDHKKRRAVDQDVVAVVEEPPQEGVVLVDERVGW